MNLIKNIFFPFNTGPLLTTDVHVSNSSVITAICPSFFTLGRMKVKIEIDSQLYFSYLTIVNPDAISSLSIKLEPEGNPGVVIVDLSWDQNELEGTNSSEKIDIWLNVLNNEEKFWYRGGKLMEGILNTGNATLTVDTNQLRPEVFESLTSISIETYQQNSRRNKRNAAAWGIGIGVVAGGLALTNSMLSDLRGIIENVVWLQDQLSKYAQAKCKSWADNADQVTGPPCPLTKEQAQNDACFDPRPNNCYGNSPASSTAQSCCYTPEGTLKSGECKARGSEKKNFINSLFEDGLPILWCCGLAGDKASKDAYLEKRPPDTGSGYQPEACRPARAAGDPHLVTFTLVNYTFNGYGEYWMAQSDNTFLQARMQPIRSGQKATVISTFVTGSLNSSKIQIELSKPNGINLYVDDMIMDLTNPLSSSMYLGSTHIMIDLPSRVVKICHETGLTITVTYIDDALSLMTTATPSFSSNGLLGNNRDGLMQTPNGTVIPFVSTGSISCVF